MTPFHNDAPTFNTRELLACVPGLSHELFKQWIRRDLVLLTAGKQIGKGRRPKYRLSDVMQVATIFEMVRQGILVSKTKLVWSTAVEPRLRSFESGLAHQLGYGEVAWAFWAHPVTGELIGRAIVENDDSEPGPDDLPEVFVLFRVDRFITRVIERINRVKAEQPAVAEDDPFYRTTPTFYGRSREYFEFMLAIDQDEKGREKLVGLSAEETAEYFKASERLWQDRNSDEQGPYSSHDERERDSDRYLELHNKHEAARQNRIADTSSERLKAMRTGDKGSPT